MLCDLLALAEITYELSEITKSDPLCSAHYRQLANRCNDLLKFVREIIRQPNRRWENKAILKTYASAKRLELFFWRRRQTIAKQSLQSLLGRQNDL